MTGLKVSGKKLIHPVSIKPSHLGENKKLCFLAEASLENEVS